MDESGDAVMNKLMLTSYLGLLQEHLLRHEDGELCEGEGLVHLFFQNLS